MAQDSARAAVAVGMAEVATEVVTGEAAVITGEAVGASAVVAAS
jgi:hypothetical protein